MSLDDMKARLAALRSARPAEPKRERPPAMAAARVTVSPKKLPDAAARATLPAAAVRPAAVPADFTIPPVPRGDGGKGSLVLSLKQLKQEARLEARKLGPKAPVPDVERPKTRGDCFGGPRPCQFVGCKFHTYLDVTEKGSLVINRPDVDVAELTASCSLDIADREPVTLEEVGGVLNLTRERVRQLEGAALKKLEVVVDSEPKYRGSCRAVSAHSGRRCQLPAHAAKQKHHDGRNPFTALAEPGQTYFEQREREEEAARAVRFSAIEAAHV